MEARSVKQGLTVDLRAALHAVGLLAIAQAVDVDAEWGDVIDALGHHQILVH